MVRSLLEEGFMEEMSFKEILQIFLEKKGWRVADLCRETKIPQSTISEIMTGANKSPRAEVLKKISLNTDISDRFLLTGIKPVLRGEIEEITTDKMSDREKIVSLQTENRILKDVLKVNKQKESPPIAKQRRPRDRHHAVVGRS